MASRFKPSWEVMNLSIYSFNGRNGEDGLAMEKEDDEFKSPPLPASSIYEYKALQLNMNSFDLMLYLTALITNCTY